MPRYSWQLGRRADRRPNLLAEFRDVESSIEMLLSNPLEYKHDCGVVPLRCLVLGGLAVVEAIKHGLYQNLLEAARRSGLDEHQGRVFGERSYGGVQSLL
jgi:hypothetical protein